MIGRSTNIVIRSNGSLAESNAVAEWPHATRKNHQLCRLHLAGCTRYRYHLNVRTTQKSLRNNTLSNSPNDSSKNRHQGRLIYFRSSLKSWSRSDHIRPSERKLELQKKVNGKHLQSVCHSLCMLYQIVVQFLCEIVFAFNAFSIWRILILPSSANVE